MTIRDDVLGQLVERALTDEQFRRDARDDLEATLDRHGFDLTDDELAAVRDFQQQVAGLTDEQLAAQLAGGRRRAGA